MVAVGTTSVRVLETVAVNCRKLENENQERKCLVKPGEGITDLFVYPGYEFKIADALITNFHLPKSTLLMLVSAFAGRDLTIRAYQEAIDKRYRFFSFGDAMLII